MINEILEIPERAEYFWEHHEQYNLPLRVPYLGMGSSYFAPLAFKYMNVEIYPEIASEYFNYQADRKLSHAVLITQSGRSSETLWCADLFDSITAITNNPHSGLALQRNVTQAVMMLAGDEKFSSSKTYINTLLTLFKGFGFDAGEAIRLLSKNLGKYNESGRKMAGQVYDLWAKEKIHGIYVTGNGPNIATAYEASLILSESTKNCFTGLPMSLYDHGPKETVQNSIVIQIMAKGRSYERALKLNDLLERKGAHVIRVEEPEAEENFSVMHNIVPFNFMAYYLAKSMNINETFLVGGKVTEVI